MTGGHEPVHQRFVFRRPAIVQRRHIVLPLLQGAWSGDRGGDKPVRQHPSDGELACGETARFGMALDLLRQRQGLGPPFRLRDTLVSPPGPAVGSGLCASLIFGGQHATRQRRISHHTHAVMMAGGQMLLLDLAVGQIVERLAGGGPVDAQRVGDMGEFRDLPGAVIGQAVIADLAGADQLAERRAVDGPLAPLPCASVKFYRRCSDCNDEKTCEACRLMREVRDAASAILDNTSRRKAKKPERIR